MNMVTSMQAHVQFFVNIFVWMDIRKGTCATHQIDIQRISNDERKLVREYG